MASREPAVPGTWTALSAGRRGMSNCAYQATAPAQRTASRLLGADPIEAIYSSFVVPATR